jgi:hypothetical protein
VTPYTIRLVPSPATDFSFQAPLWLKDRHGEPQARCKDHQGSVGALPKQRAQSPWQGGHGIATQCTISYEAVMLHPTQGSREVTPSSGRETPFNIATHGTQEGIKGSKMTHKRHFKWTMTMTDSNNGEAGPTTNHFKRLFEEACPNHAYPIRHKLKD